MIGAGLDDLLEVVEDQQDAAVAEPARRATSAIGSRAASSAMPERPGDRRRDEHPGRGPARAATKQTPSGKASAAVAATCEREPGLARAAGAGQRQQPGRARAGRAASASSSSRPTNVVSWVGRLFGRASSERSGGNSVGSPSASTWPSRSGARRSRSRCSPRSRSVTPSRQRAVDEGPGRVRGHDLAAVRGGRDPGRPVDVEADEAAAGQARLAGVEAHPDRGPWRRRATARRRGRAGRRRPPRRPRGRWRRRRRTSRPRCPARRRRGRRSAARRIARCRSRTSRVARGPDPLLEARRALDVGEQEGRRSRSAPAPVDAVARPLRRRRRLSAVRPSVRSRSRPASPRRIASATDGSSRTTASKSQVARARQVVGPSATTWADARPAVEHRQLPEELAGPEPGDDLRRRGSTRAPPGAMTKKPGADLALAGDDVVRREVDLDRPRRDPVHAVGVDAGEQARPRPAARPDGRGSGSCVPPDARPRRRALTAMLRRADGGRQPTQRLRTMPASRDASSHARASTGRPGMAGREELVDAIAGFALFADLTDAAARGHRPHLRGGGLRRGRADPPPGHERLRVPRDPRRRGGRRRRRHGARPAGPRRLLRGGLDPARRDAHRRRRRDPAAALPRPGRARPSKAFLIAHPRVMYRMLQAQARRLRAANRWRS